MVLIGPAVPLSLSLALSSAYIRRRCAPLIPCSLSSCACPPQCILCPAACIHLAPVIHASPRHERRVVLRSSMISHATERCMSARCPPACRARACGVSLSRLAGSAVVRSRAAAHGASFGRSHVERSASRSRARRTAPPALRRSVSTRSGHGHRHGNGHGTGSCRERAARPGRPTRLRPRGRAESRGRVRCGAGCIGRRAVAPHARGLHLTGFDLGLSSLPHQ